jgi:hypothetical protein
MRIVLLAVVFLIIAAVPARAQEKLCGGQGKPAPPLTKEQKEQADLESWAQQRAEFGFRHDIPYVKELVKRGVWEYDVGYIPVTPAENRYLKLRDELELGARAERYLRAHKDIDGGVSVEDDWPHEPYLLLHLTRDVPKHLSAIRALANYPHNLRAVKVRYSDKALEKVADRLWHDQKALAAQGIYLTGTGHGDADALDVDVITARADVYDDFKHHYGDAVKVEVEAREQYSYDCVASSDYEIAPDGMSLTLFWSSGGGRKPARVEVTEFPDHVEVGAVEQVYNGPSAAVGFGAQMSAQLSAPLGDRAVIDAFNGKRLLQVGPKPGEPACPPVPDELTPLADGTRRRAEFGMRADSAYVQSLLDRGHLFTKPEERWWRRYQALSAEHLDVKNKTYAGSVVIANHYPAPPLSVYRFTRDAHAHLADLRKRSKYPDAIRVENTSVTTDQLDALNKRIAEDAQAADRFFDGYGRAGLYLVGLWRDELTMRVELQVITPRPDAVAYFTSRYGPLVHVSVIGDRFECAASYSPRGLSRPL